MLFFCLFVCYLGFAQQDAQYTQYMYNTININPAYAGSRGVMSVFGLYRNQWVGMDGAPVTDAFSVNTPLGIRSFGMGVSFVGDRIGPSVSYNSAIDLSYTISLSDSYKMAFGLKGSVQNFTLEASKLNPSNNYDPSLFSIRNTYSTNIGSGLYIHSAKNYVGISIPNIFQTKRYSDNEMVVYQEKYTFYGIGGFVFDITPDIKYKPAFLVKIVQGAPIQCDVSSNVLLYEKFVLGAAWRWNATMSFLTGFQVTDGLYIGYGYDLETTKLNNYNSGSHEIFMRWEWNKKQSRIVSPRFF
nr:type IX secretion system membrane protein PorP/SprF [Flavobacterium aciduliphilum]